MCNKEKKYICFINCIYNDGNCSPLPYENMCWNCDPVFDEEDSSKIVDWIPIDTDDE